MHHLRKQGDSDPLNKLSGTTGIIGAVDAVFVLDRSKRRQDSATLIATGRDIEYRELELLFCKDTHTWELIADSLEEPLLLLPKEMSELIAFVQSIGSFTGRNTEFTEQFNSASGESISAKSLKQLMNKWRYALEEHGVFFLSHRSNGERLVDVRFVQPNSDASAVSDAENGSAKICDPCVPCVPVYMDGESEKQGKIA